MAESFNISGDFEAMLKAIPGADPQKLARAMGITIPPPRIRSTTSSTPTPPSSRQVNLGQAIFGAGVSPFSPYFGARTLAQSGVFGKGTSFASIGPVIGGVIVGMKLFHLALSALTAAVERGAKLYQQAAMTAKSPSALAGVQLALQGIGISPSAANQLLLQAQWARGRGIGGNIGGMLVRAGGSTGQTGEMQQIANMSKELNYMFQRSKDAADTLGKTSGAMQRISMQADIFKNQWSAAFSEFMSANEGIIRQIAVLGTGFAKLITLIARPVMALISGGSTEFYNAIFKTTNLGKGPGDQRLAGGAASPLMGAGAALQRIGFSFGNFPGIDYAKQTAQNTRRIADAVSGGSASRGIWSTPYLNPGRQGAAFNMP